MNECKQCAECSGGWHHLLEGADKESGEPIVECKHCDFAFAIADIQDTKFIETTKNFHGFYFICEACGEEGVLGIPRYGSKRISCPGECGASYVLWDNPRTNYPDLMCVVRPVFEEGKPWTKND